MKNCIVKIINGVPVVFGETGKDNMDSLVYIFEEEEAFNAALDAGLIPVGTLIVKTYDEVEMAGGPFDDALSDESENAVQNKVIKKEFDEMNKPWQKIFYTNSLKETGTIEGFNNYSEYLILLTAGEYANTHYVPRIVLETAEESGIIFTTSHYFSNESHKMSTSPVNSNGEYSAGRGLSQNSSASTVTVYAK